MRKIIGWLLGICCILGSNAWAEGLTLSAKSFFNQEILPNIYTCDDRDISPALSWSGVPAKTKSLALIVTDIDAPGGIFYHWIVYNIPPTETDFAEDMKDFPANTMLGKNSWNHTHYDGPCPPKGSVHHYIFTLYALDATLNLPKDSDAITVINSLSNHVIEISKLTVKYSH